MELKLRRRPVLRWAGLPWLALLPITVVLISAAQWREVPSVTRSSLDPTPVLAARAPGVPLDATPVLVASVSRLSFDPAPVLAAPIAISSAGRTDVPEAPPTPARSQPVASSTSKPVLNPTHAPTATPAPTQVPTVIPTATSVPGVAAADGVQRTARVPILMYHHVDSTGPGADALRQDLSISPAAFEEQLAYLKEEGYEGTTLDELAAHLRSGKPLPERPIILTFDDGYSDAYTRVFPALKRYGFVGTFFLVTAPIDAGNPDFLSWEQVKEMHAAGMVFEPHSYDHPDMRDRTFDFVVFQILASQGAIQERTGEPCRFFAYPSGRYDQFVVDVLRSAGYVGAVLTEQGATHTTGSLFTLRRVRVHGGDRLADLIQRLNADW